MATAFSLPVSLPGERYDNMKATALSDFRFIRQGTANNMFTRTRDNRGTTLDPIAQALTVKNGNYEVKLSGLSHLSATPKGALLRTCVSQLFDSLVLEYTATGSKEPTVSITLDDYMTARGLTDRKEARKQVKTSLEILYGASISFTEKRNGKKGRSFYDTRLISAKGIVNSVIQVTFTKDIMEILQGYPIMPYPLSLLRISGWNQTAYYLLRRIAEHKHMNTGKKNENIISVKTLLTSAPNLPTYSEAMERGQHLKQSIIDPFNKAMDSLDDTLTWELCGTGGRPLTDDEIDRQDDYETFSRLLVKVIWRDYPATPKRAKSKKKKDTKSKGKK